MALFQRRSSLFGGGLFGRRRALDHEPARGYGYGYGAALTPPSLLIFVVAIVLAASALLTRYAHVDVPLVTAANAFDVLAAAFAALVAGVLIPRL